MHKLLARDDVDFYMPTGFQREIRSTRNSDGRKFVLPQHRLSSENNSFTLGSSLLMEYLKLQLMQRFRF